MNREEFYIEILQLTAKRSKCLRAQVGAIIVKDGRIISLGYNGPASGEIECLPEEYFLSDEGILSPSKWFIDGYRKCMGKSCDRSIHAEMNAIAFAAKAGISVKDCDMYCSLSPCSACARLLINSGIRAFYYLKEYRDSTGLDILSRHLSVEKIFAPSGDHTLTESEPSPGTGSSSCPTCNPDRPSYNVLSPKERLEQQDYSYCPKCGGIL